VQPKVREERAVSTVATRIGKFVWHEQVSSEPEQAQGFYTQLFGWGTEVFKAGEMDYTMISSGGSTHGGFSKAMEGAPPPHWLGHIGVENLDETIEKAKSAGGQLVAGPFDMEDVGRMAILTDPQGAFVSAYQSLSEGSGSAGVFVWDELGTTDVDGAQRFYEAVFGWTTKDMGEDFGGYRIFHRGEEQVAGLMANPKPEIPAMWTPYIGVDDTDAMCKKATDLGAKVLVEPMDVPTVGRFAILNDPQGAVFGIIKGEPTS
jgi:predicted enzyme related to lactoylglutathione lyase